MQKFSLSSRVLVLWLAALSINAFNALGNTTSIAVVGFTLINAKTGLEVVDISDGDVINLAELPSRQINIIANFQPNTLPLQIGSIIFHLNTAKQVENHPPYALKGNQGTNYTAWTPSLGSYTLTAIPYSEANGTGTAGTGHTIRFTVIDKPLNLPKAVYRINTGGKDYITPEGVIFEADNYAFSSQAIYQNRILKEIEGTDADGLYTSEHISDNDLGGFYYYLPVSAGNYTIKLHFAEIYFGVAGGQPSTEPVGKRVFNVDVDGDHNLTNFDIAAEVGVARALVKTFEVSSNDGNITISFSGKVNRPKISAIEVLVSSTPNKSPVANAGQNKAIRLPDNSTTLVGTWSDEDGFVTDVQWIQISGPPATMKGTTSSNLELSNLVANTYKFKFTVTDNNGATASDEVFLVVLAASPDLLQVNVFPNPMIEVLHISYDSPGKAPITIRLYNRYGKLYYERLNAKEVKNYKVNVSSLPPNIYLLQVESEGAVKTVQVVKN